jgi:hypothetical protein
MTALGRLARAASLAALAVAGLLLGSCGGDESARTTATGLTTRPAVTATRPAVPTRTSETPAPTTTEETATEPVITVTEPSTTEPPRTVTTVETETTVLPPRTTTAPPPPPTATVTTTEPTPSTSNTAWGWIALALAIVGAGLIGLLLWRRQRTHGKAWSRGHADLSRRSLLAVDEVVAEGSLVTGQVQALANEARSLESSAPNDKSRGAAAGLRVRLDDLAAALEADRTLRLGSTPPSEEQLAYSTSLIRHQLEQLQDVLRPADAGEGPT